MSLQIGQTAPDFTAETTEGQVRFHDWIGDGWAVLFSHPKDFTPVCTTELGAVARLKSEFDKRGIKVIGLSVFQSAVIMFYISMGKVAGGTAPILPQVHGELVHDPGVVYSNPVPHVLMLTAIVVGVATTALALALVVRIYDAYGTIEEYEILQQERDGD